MNINELITYDTWMCDIKCKGIAYISHRLQICTYKYVDKGVYIAWQKIKNWQPQASNEKLN